MRNCAGAILMLAGTAGSCLAQDDRPPPSVTPEQREAVSDKRAAEIKAVLREGRKRQDAIDASYRALMARWSLAVCIGCEPAGRRPRILHTYPLRVLAGFSAVEDDARERRGRIPL
ncbi:MULTISPECIES: hypothetical protein [Methylobacterium]|uniref:Uncharacterized protein n=1 Tax=Methylobacterium thuringiense TaxID=1003091 RepID=A0ABQ4TT67_9HYPH|nr:MULTISPECIES: hypothetical protein [Methylobacterium]TXN19334.1 hypothetical protein FV217_21750 [Methylobacterium sp. WL9]GJE57852.1 hypothetical protein EKPJFOCH_4374 [Methylobacterium thuringiense]